MLTVSFLCLIAAAVLAVGQRFALALKRAGISVKEAALNLGVSEMRVYAFMRDQSPMDIRRLDRMPTQFHDEFDGLNVASRGGVVLTDSRIAKLLEQVDEFAMAKAELLATAVPRRYTVELPLTKQEKAS